MNALFGVSMKSGEDQNVSGVIPSISKARFTSSALGSTTGIIELMNALVMLEERPVIFIGVGIRNNDK